MFLLKFDLQILYKSDKSHIILNALNHLLNHNNINECVNTFDIDAFNVYNDFIMMILKDFNDYVWKIYKKNAI